MAGQRVVQMIARVWRTAEILQNRRAGITATALGREAGISRSTVYRYLDLLERAGAPIAGEGVNGETRYRLAGGALPALGPGSAGRVALGLARELLAPIEGTDAVKELDDFIARFRAGPANPISAASRKALHDPAIARALERAIAGGRQVIITHRGLGRRVDPAALRVAGAHAYLVAWDPARRDWRTFKLARIEAAELLAEPVAPHPAFGEAALFGHSVRIWHGDAIDVRVRLSPEVAAIAREYPLVDDQRVTPEPDGSVVVDARVAGIVEATRWVLGWGRAAEALAPPALREAVEAELRGALLPYARPGVAKGVSRMVRPARGMTARSRNDER